MCPQRENSAVILIKTVMVGSPDANIASRISIPPKPRIIGAKPLVEEATGISLLEQTKQVLRNGWPRLNSTGVDYDVFVESINGVKPIQSKSLIILNTDNGKFALTKVPAEEMMVQEPSMSNVGCSGKDRIVVPTPAYTYYISKIEKNNGKNGSEENSIEELKNLLKTAVPEKGDVLGVDYVDFICGIKGYKGLPKKSVILVEVEWLDVETGEKKSGVFGISKIPPEKLTDDSSLVDIGYDGNGKTTISISKVNHYIFRIKDDNGVEEHEPGLILDIDIESEKGPEFDRIFQFFTDIDNEEVKRIVMQAEFQANKKIASEIIKTEIKEDNTDGQVIPYLEAETKDEKKYGIYLIEELDLGGKKIGDERHRGTTGEYFIPKCFENCVKINAGQYQYAVLILQN